MKKILLLLGIFLMVASAQAEEAPFKESEVLKYDIHFKWGLVMMKAGTANHTIIKSSYENNPTYKTTLDFKTTSFFDGIFKIRDTLFSHLDSANLEPLYHIRKINEGKTHFKEEIFIEDRSENYTKARVKRQNAETVRFDTTMVSSYAGYDMLSIFSFARTLDYSRLTPGETMHISSFIGKAKINITVYFKGQSVIEKGESVKYKAYRLAADIGDTAFNESKSAMEIWVSDDENHIPLKIKAKLKIGIAEAHLNSWQNLKYPFTSEIKIPNR